MDDSERLIQATKLIEQICGMVRELRDAQKEFHDSRRRKPSSLDNAKTLEKKIDKFLEEMEPDHIDDPLLF
jgi:hypothetical protein